MNESDTMEIVAVSESDNFRKALLYLPYPASGRSLVPRHHCIRAVWGYGVLMDLVRVHELIAEIRSCLSFAGLSQVDNPRYAMACVINLRASIGRLRNQCEGLGMYVASDTIDAALKVLDSSAGGKDGEILERMVNNVASVIQSELKRKLFLTIPPERADFYSGVELFGPDVEAAFPSASPEIDEAGKCLACGRYSASVFHLMRTLEVGISCLAKKFGVDAANKNWQNVLDQTMKQVNEISATSHGQDWRDDKQFYSEAVAHFHVLKNAWRNYAMHLHERYDEERARNIFSNVRAFMRHLAQRLHE